MSGQQTGGPAFPQPYDSIVETSNGRELASGWTGYPDKGMTLRDYFAAEAMSATPPDYYSDLESVAARSYALADAMLAERSKAK